MASLTLHSISCVKPLCLMLVALEYIFWWVGFYSSSRNHCEINTSVHQHSSYIALTNEVIADMTWVFQSENLARNIK